MAERPLKEILMVEDRAPVRRRRLGGHGMMFRRRRIFVQLREGYTYDEIAAEEGVSPSRIRQIVSQELQQRAVDSGAEHAKLQLDRLAPAIQLAAEGIAANYGIDEAFEAAVKEHLKKQGVVLDDEPGEAEGQEMDPGYSPEPTAPDAPHPEAPAESNFFYSNRRNPLKSPDSKK